MDCTKYDELMSLHLDGLLEADDEKDLLKHIAICEDCAPIWLAMTMADSLLVASAAKSLPPPVDFTAKVMLRVSATSIVRPVFEQVAVPQLVPALPSILPAQFGGPDNPFYIPAISLGDWQHRVPALARTVVTVGLSMAASFGILLLLLVSGTVKSDASFAPVVSTLRTFFAALNSWAQSLLTGFGTQALVGSSIVIGMLALAAWQVINNHYTAASEPNFEMGVS
jgi:hypothetical protein